MWNTPDKPYLQLKILLGTRFLGQGNQSPKINNDLSQVSIMTQIMTKSKANTNLIVTHYTKNNEPALNEYIFLSSIIISLEYNGLNEVVYLFFTDISMKKPFDLSCENKVFNLGSRSKYFVSK